MARTAWSKALMREDRSSEIASHEGALFAWDQVLLGCYLAGALGLDQLGDAACTRGGVAAQLVFGAVRAAYAWASAQLGGHGDVLAARVEPRGLGV
jgi:hypothetical protein